MLNSGEPAASMPSAPSKALLLVLVVLALISMGSGLWWMGRGRAGPPPLVRPAEIEASVPTQTSEPPIEEPRDELGEPADLAEEPAGTSVIWPLEVQLTLVAGTTFTREPGMPPPGSGATAALRGHVWGPSDEGLRARIHFTAGSNKGRELVCDAEGAFGSTDLYSGLNIVRIETPVGFSAEREVRLRSRQEELLNIGFGRPAAVFGSVLDMQGKPLGGAEVTLDGHSATTDVEGVFYFPQVAGGMPLATVRMPGFALYRESVPITAGRTIEKNQLEFRLAAEAKLEIVLEGAAGSVRSPALVYLFPIGPQRVNTLRGQQTFPWHLVSPIELYPGGSQIVDGLADGHVLLATFRPGAIAEPTAVKVRVYEGRTTQQVVRLTPGPALRGRIVRAGKGVDGARVRLEAPNRQSASEIVLRKDPEFAQELVFPQLPAGMQESFTDAEGRFQLTLYPDVSTGYYLTAETTDGLWRAGRAVSIDETEGIELELERTTQTTATLRLGLSSRFQALPVAIRIMGAPRDPFELGPRDEELAIDGLEPGTWRVDVTWHGQRLLENILVEVGEDTDPKHFIKLPPGAVDGQTAEERRRAGR